MAVYSERIPCWQTRSLLAWCIISTVLLLVLLPVYSIAENYGYDSASSCDPSRASRRGRSQLLKTIPCDLSVQAYCNLPGSAYPWHAVRRFVHENQGLMRRMYGDVRHISVLKEEFESNEIEIDDIGRATERYSRQPEATSGRERRVDSGKRMKYLRPSSTQHYEGLGHYLRDKSNEIPFNEPHFRPAQLKSMSTTTTETTTTTITTPRSTISISDPLKLSTDMTVIPSTPKPETPATAKSITTTTTRSTATAATVESPPRTSPHSSIDQPKHSTQVPPENEAMLPQMQDKTDFENKTNTDPMINYETGKNTDVVSTVNTENTKLDTSSAVEVDRLNSSDENVKRLPVDGDSINLEALSSLAKLETSEAIFASAEPDEQGVGMGEVAVDGKISTTLKLSTGSLPTAVEELQKHQVPPYDTESSVKVEEIESIISSYPNDRQGTDTGNVDIDKHEMEDTEGNAKTVGGALAHSDSVPASSTIHQQKIRFESIKGGVGVGTSPIKKTNAEGQLFQDTAQKEPSVVNGRGVNACPVKEEVVAPFWANNTRGEVLALLNLYPFEQYVHWEKCTHELKQMYCREGCRCEQQYRLHRLLAYDPHNECRGIFSDWFRFPSCCICKCYDMPFDFRVTSRSPRSLTKESIELVEDELQNAIYEHATDEWYRPKEYGFD